MKITFWKGIFVADALPEEHGKLKKGGFVPHEPTLCEDPARCKACRARIGRRYWSSRVEDATRLRSYCNQRALSVMKEHLARLEKSRAVSSNIRIPSPPELEYLPYQKAGVAYALQRKDTLIGDEAGLGKTIQAIGFINYTKPRSVLVVAPATLAYNWKVEAEKWLVDPYLIFIPQTGLDAIPELGPNERLLVITNYEKIVPGVRHPLCPECQDMDDPGVQCPRCMGKGKIKVANFESAFLKSLQRPWDLSIYDEVHALKNPSSKRSQAVLGQFGLFNRSHRTLSLSGTPIENYPKEIWALAATVCPTKFGDWWAFARRYCGLHEEQHGDRAVMVSTGHAHLSELQQRLRATFMVRRLKRDVLKELPPKRRQLVILGDQEVDWSKHPEFRRWKELYERDYEAAMARLEAAKTLEAYNRAVKALEAFIGIAFNEMSEFRHKTALAKLPLCLRYIDDLLANGLDNVVIFAHHKDVLEKTYEHYKDSAVLLYGGTPMDKRGPIVKEFQDGPKRVFVGGLKAAGTGITLTKASTVIFIEIDWVPATLTQAEDRLCRIGQKKMVHVIHLVLNNTLDVNMSQRVIAKQDVIDKTLDHLPEHIRMQQVNLPLP
jgi:SWI/SNF-related matrix-associated actin-dependent regulator of chromatin subfamily A-like protein 1